MKPSHKEKLRLSCWQTYTSPLVRNDPIIFSPSKLMCYRRTGKKHTAKSRIIKLIQAVLRDNRTKLKNISGKPKYLHFNSNQRKVEIKNAPQQLKIRLTRTDIHFAKIITTIIKRKIVLIELNRQPTHNIIQITILRIIKKKNCN